MRLPKRDQSLLAEAYEQIVSEVSIPWIKNKLESSYRMADTGYNKERYSNIQSKMATRMKQDTNSIPVMINDEPYLIQLVGFEEKRLDGRRELQPKVVKIETQNEQGSEGSLVEETLTIEFPDRSLYRGSINLKLANAKSVSFLDRNAANQFIDAYKKLLAKYRLEIDDILRVQDMPISNSKGGYGSNPGTTDETRSKYDALKAGRTKNFNPKPKFKGSAGTATIAGESPTSSIADSAQYSYRQR